MWVTKVQGWVSVCSWLPTRTRKDVKQTEKSVSEFQEDLSRERNKPQGHRRRAHTRTLTDVHREAALGVAGVAHPAASPPRALGCAFAGRLLVDRVARRRSAQPLFVRRAAAAAAAAADGTSERR